MQILNVMAVVVMALSLAIPLYSIVMLVRSLIVSSPYSAWPPLLFLLVWIAQWPLVFILSFRLPGAGSYAGDGHESALFDLSMLGILVLYNAGPFYWVLRHRARFVHRD
jgi:hypothetical protein